MDYKEALGFIYHSYLSAEKHQDYSAPDSIKRSPDLLKTLLNDENTNGRKGIAPVCCVTGSKGKGSVSSYLSALLSLSGRCGLETGPHIESFTERISISGKDIQEDELARVLSEINAPLEEIQRTLPKDKCISPVGIIDLIARRYFKEQNVKYEVFESGKGAQFDDTARIYHEYAVITPIFLEHKRELGGTVEEIARDKAHIISDETRHCITASQRPEVLSIIKERAKEKGCILHVLGEDFSPYDGELSMRGDFQKSNAALALKAASLMTDITAFGEKEISDALFSVRKRGRLEVIKNDPPVILDCCIGSDSAPVIAENIKKLYPKTRFISIICVPSDKDRKGVSAAVSSISDEVIEASIDVPHYRFEKGLPDAIALMKKYIAENKPLLLLGTTAFVSEVVREVR